MKALVLGHAGNENHEQSVRSHFLANSPSGWDCDIAMVGSGTTGNNIVTYLPSINKIVEYSINNNYKIIIRSYSNVFSFKFEWDYATDNNVIVVHAHGSNENIKLTYPPYLISAITVGGGVTSNVRSYGPGLELYGQTNDNYTEESWVTAVVAGRVATIIDNNPFYNIYDVRQHLRQTCDLYVSGWNENNGFGKVQQYTPVNLHIGSPLSFTHNNINDSTILFTWKNFLQTNYTNTTISSNKVGIIYSGTSTSYQYSATTSGDHTFTISSVSGNTKYSNIQEFDSITYNLSIQNPGAGDETINSTLNYGENGCFVNSCFIVGNNSNIKMFSQNGTLFTIKVNDDGLITTTI